MENIEQENIQEIQQENLLEGKTAIKQIKEQPQVSQLIQSKETIDEIAKAEKQYRETIRRENK